MSNFDKMMTTVTFLETTVTFLDKWDLTPIQVILSFSGCLLSIWYMQLAGYIVTGESRLLFCVRRFGVAMIAGGLLWSVSYAYYRDWQPWPPYLLVLFGINMALFAAILTANAARKREEAKSAPSFALTE